MGSIDQCAAHQSGGWRWSVGGQSVPRSPIWAHRSRNPPATSHGGRRRPLLRRSETSNSPQVTRVQAKDYGVYGARKVWAPLKREGIAVARCVVERLMRAQGHAGACRRRQGRTTLADCQRILRIDPPGDGGF
ncbi:IS3 family transposase [Pseudonocardia xishanensis]|uniref:IS3 family transposase n=1 Tax=Pseudonocardia xishanensis TaxID=630995 RepID=UPI003CD0A7BF